ncbi:hypothetical protein BH23GEM3_BH23GEM3_19920 [soil metagenome]
MRDLTHLIRPAQPASRKPHPRLPLAAALLACGALAGCGSLLTGPLSLEEGWRMEATFLSESLIPAANFARQAEAPPPAVEYGGVTLQASVVPVDTASDAGTMGLNIEVRARNTSAETVRLPVRGCTVWPEFHDGAERTGDPVWVPRGACAQAPYEVVLAPGEEHAFGFHAYDVMLAQGVEDGRYYVTARFHQRNETLRLSAGSADVRLRVPNLAFRIRVEEGLTGGLSARVRVENRNPGAVRLEYGACAVGFELHRDAELAGKGIPLYPPRGHVCPDYLVIAGLAPGEVLEPREFEYRVSKRATQGVPRGVYHLAVTLNLNARTYRFPGGTVRVGR